LAVKRSNAKGIEVSGDETEARIPEGPRKVRVMPQPQNQEKTPGARRPHHLREAAGVAAVIPQHVGTIPKPQPDFAVHLREQFYQLLFQSAS
jgi:hypothetical protein